MSTSQLYVYSVLMKYAVVQATAGRVPQTALVHSFLASNALVSSLLLLASGSWRAAPLDRPEVVPLLLACGVIGFAGQGALTAVRPARTEPHTLATLAGGI